MIKVLGIVVLEYISEAHETIGEENNHQYMLMFIGTSSSYSSCSISNTCLVMPEGPSQPTITSALSTSPVLRVTV